MFQTTAEPTCELTRVWPSGLNSTSLVGVVSAVSGDPYGTPVFASHTKTDPSKEAAANSRPSGTEVQRIRRLVADGQRLADRPSGRDVDHRDRAGVVAREYGSAVAGEDRRLHVLLADHERPSDAAPSGDLPDPDLSGGAGHEDPPSNPG